MESTLRGPLPADLKVIETLGWSPETGAARLDGHMARAKRTCAIFGYSFDRPLVEQALRDLQSDTPLRLRMTWGEGGFEMTTAPKGEITKPWTIALHQTPLISGDEWLGVKTTHRALYDRARVELPEEIDEYLFLNESGFVCEGSITNVFLLQGDLLLTPPASDGLLPGILRAELLERGKAREAHLRVNDLMHGEIFVGNSLRGLIPAHLSG